MSTSTTQSFSEFKSNSNGEFRMRLGHSEYVQKNQAFYRVSKSGHLYLIEESELVAKPWIQQNFDRERKFQKREAKAELFSQPCFQRTPYSANQRIAYNNAKHN